MIYLENKTAGQRVVIPHETDAAGDPTALVLHGTVSGRKWSAPAEFLVESDNGRYFFVSVALPSGLADGSYEYALMAGDTVLASGCAILGDFSDETTEYDKSIEIRQYGEN